MIHFEHPSFFLFLVPIAVFALWLGRRGRPAAIAISSVETVRCGSRVRRSRWGRLLPALAWLGASLFVVALAGPVTEKRHAQVHASGVDVMLAMDVSGSMQAEDMASNTAEAGMQSRIDAAKEVVRRFVADRTSDRIGVVAFAGEPRLASPLTLDHAWVDGAVEHLDPDTLHDGTAIGSALAAAVRRLDAQDAKSKVVVLLTDGQNNAGKIDPRAAAEAARALGVKVYTVGVGSVGKALVPVKRDDGRREMVMSKVDVDEKTLTDVAAITGGKFFRATDTKSLGDVYSEIDRLEKTTRTVASFTERTPQITWLVLPGVGLVGLSLLLSATRFRRVP